MSKNKQPVHEVRLGRIKATIWENDVENGVRRNVAISRLYKDGEQWKESSSFGRDDLPLVGKVADIAHSWIFEQYAGHRNKLTADVSRVRRQYVPETDSRWRVRLQWDWSF